MKHLPSILFALIPLLALEACKPDPEPKPEVDWRITANISTIGPTGKAFNLGNPFEGLYNSTYTFFYDRRNRLRRLGYPLIIKQYVGYDPVKDSIIEVYDYDDRNNPWMVLRNRILYRNAGLVEEILPQTVTPYEYDANGRFIARTYARFVPGNSSNGAARPLGDPYRVASQISYTAAGLMERLVIEAGTQRTTIILRWDGQSRCTGYSSTTRSTANPAFYDSTSVEWELYEAGRPLDLYTFRLFRHPYYSFDLSSSPSLLSSRTDHLYDGLIPLTHYYPWKRERRFCERKPDATSSRFYYEQISTCQFFPTSQPWQWDSLRFTMTLNPNFSYPDYLRSFNRTVHFFGYTRL
jgi:YD repeat-containing protein